MSTVTDPKPRDDWAGTRSWAVQHTPAIGVAALAGKAAVAGCTHVARGVEITVTGPDAQPLIYITLFDGPIATGTKLLQIPVQFPAGGSGFTKFLELPDLACTDNTALTLATTNLAGVAVTPAANNVAAIALMGATLVS